MNLLFFLMGEFRALWFLVAAYSAIWVIVGFQVYMLLARNKRLTELLGQLERRVDELEHGGGS